MGIETGRLGVFGHRGAVRAERAVAELRAGRPVVIQTSSGATAALALDAATPSVFRAFATAAEGGHELFLTSHRARALGLDAPQGCLVPLQRLSHEGACRLAYLSRQEAPPAWRTGTADAALAARLARLALLLPAIVLADMRDRADEFADCVEVREKDIHEAQVSAGRTFEIVTRSRVPLQDVGRAEFVVFRGGLAQRDQLAILVGNVRPGGPTPVRIHSACITGDLFGSLRCDCGDQLRRSLKAIDQAGGGVLLYLDQEGRGTGIAAKLRAYGYQDEGLDTFDADAELGFGPDERHYDTAVAMLRELGIDCVNLLTNNPEKLAFLRAAGIEVVGRTPVIGPATPENHGYLRAKAVRGGHMLPVAEL
jgi:GTP cyclohydrolase II